MLPLSGLRVLECGDTLAGAYAGRLLADLGASVVVIEPIGGHPLRSVGPYVLGGPGVERSAEFGYFAAGKQAVCHRPAVLASLVDAADVVVHASLLGDDWLAPLRGAFRHGLIVVDISTFGRPAAGGGSAPFDDLLSLAAGDYEWVAISVRTDPQFHALAAVIGRPDLVDDRRFATAGARHTNPADLDAIIAVWSAPLDAQAAAAALQSAGSRPNTSVTPKALPSHRRSRLAGFSPSCRMPLLVPDVGRSAPRC